MTVGSLVEAVVTTDAQGTITYLNPAAEAMAGWTATEAVGRPLSSVFRVLGDPGVLVSRDGAERPIQQRANPIRDADGGLIGTVVVFHDETARRELQLLERDLQEKLEQRVQERTAELQASEER